MNRYAKGDAKLFREIAEQRQPLSYVSGVYIHQLGPGNFAHVLPKGRYPEMRHDPENIVLLTEKEHRLFDHGTEQQREQYAQDMQKQGVEVDWECLYSLREKLLYSKSNQNQSK